MRIFFERMHRRICRIGFTGILGNSQTHFIPTSFHHHGLHLDRCPWGRVATPGHPTMGGQSNLPINLPMGINRAVPVMPSPSLRLTRTSVASSPVTTPRTGPTSVMGVDVESTACANKLCTALRAEMSASGVAGRHAPIRLGQGRLCRTWANGRAPRDLKCSTNNWTTRAAMEPARNPAPPVLLAATVKKTARRWLARLPVVATFAMWCAHQIAHSATLQVRGGFKIWKFWSNLPCLLSSVVVSYAAAFLFHLHLDITCLRRSSPKTMAVP